MEGTPEDLRVLIVQDRLTVPGGGEKVVHQMSHLYDSTVVTGEHRPDGTYDFSHTDVIELGGNTFAEFVKLRTAIDWTEYDVAVFSGNRPQFTLWRPLPIPSIRYCHSPARTFWSLRDRDFRESPLGMKIARLGIAPVFRTLDRTFSSNHDLILTNSNNVRSQVDRFYGLDADVLYPPIDTTNYSYNESGDFWLSVNRLVPKKRVREQIEAFDGLDDELVIVGEIDHKFQRYGEEMVELAESVDNVTITGFMPDDELRELYADCRGAIYLPYFEDFGMVPIEAMASGKPVIAAAEGGPLETVDNGETGWLIPPRRDELESTLREPFDPQTMKRNCTTKAQQFDISSFRETYSDAIKSVV